MTSRKRRGIGFLISGVVFVGAGAVFLGFDTTPEWLALVLQGVGLIANLLGFVAVFPDVEE